MTETTIKRPNYYEGQYLGAKDLLAAQEYQRQQDQRHRLAAHTWGIAAGFELEEVKQAGGSGPVDVFIRPGYAVDGFGRSIINLEPYKLPPGLFAQFIPKVGTPKQLIPVWLRYREVKTSPAKPGFEICTDEEQMYRIAETFTIEVGDLPLSQKLTDLIIAGKPAPANDGKTGELFRSIPYQELPDPNDKARWFILLGFVSWSGTQLVASDNPDSLSFARPYIGTIAETIQAPAGKLRIRDRKNPKPLIPETPELLGIEGSLRVDGISHFLDLLITDSFVNIDSQNRNTGNAAPGGTPLGGPALTFGFLSLEGIASQRTGTGNLNGLDFYTKNKTHLSITNGGNIGIGTKTPVAKLEVAADWTGEEGALCISGDKPTVRFTGGAPANNESWIAHLGSHGPGNLEFFHRTGPAAWDAILSLTPKGRVGIGTTAPSRKLEIVGDLQVTGGNIFVGTTQIPIHTPVDVVVGQKFFAGQLTGNGSGSGFVSVSVVSRLAAASSATVMVALSDISNIKEAINARWRVHTNGVATVGTTGTNATASFDVFWQIDDDGEIHSFQFVVVFQP